MKGDLITTLTLDKVDKLRWSRIEDLVNKFLRKFYFSDLTPENINYIVNEANTLIKQRLREEVLMDRGKQGVIRLCAFKYVSVKVDKVAGTVDIRPVFEIIEELEI